MITCKHYSGINNEVSRLNKQYSRTNLYDDDILDNLGLLFNFKIYGEETFLIGNMIAYFLTEIMVRDDARAELLARTTCTIFIIMTKYCEK